MALAVGSAVALASRRARRCGAGVTVSELLARDVDLGLVAECPVRSVPVCQVPLCDLRGLVSLRLFSSCPVTASANGWVWGAMCVLTSALT